MSFPLPTLPRLRALPPLVGALAVLLSLRATLPAASSEWPEFRGPTGQGHSSVAQLPLEWDATNHVAWKQPVPGQGWSSPVLAGGKVYLTAAVPADGGALSLRALALSARDGKLLWNQEVFLEPKAGSMHQKNSPASPTPIVADGRLYVHFGHQGTACLDLDGKSIWRNTELRYSPVHGSGGSPILVGDALVFSCDGGSDPFVVALNRQDGHIRWKSPRITEAHKKFSFCTPLLISVKGQQQIISPGSGAVCALEPATGKEIWRVRYGEGYSVVPRPVFGHDLLFLSSGFDTAAALAIRPGGTGDLTDSNVAWTLKRGAPQTPSMLLVGEELYMVSDAGIASCLNAQTGEAYWQERVGGGFSASPILAAGRIYLLNEEGTTTVLKPGRAFEKLATNPLGERALASMAVGANSLFIRTEHHLYCVSDRSKAAAKAKATSPGPAAARAISQTARGL